MDQAMTLETRAGLPDALRVLVRDYPRNIWEGHGNFDELTRFWLSRHLMFRDTLARIEDVTAAYLDRSIEARAFGAQSARLTGFLLNQLQGHHQIEDTHYFPRLAGLDARLTAGFALLDADHHALDAHIHGLADSTNAMLRALSEAPETAKVGPLQRQLAGFARFIDRHLVDEEELVIPVILHHAPDL